MNQKKKNKKNEEKGLEEKNKPIILAELNRIKNYFILLEPDTLIEYLNQKELSTLINEKLITIEKDFKKDNGLKKLKESINKFFITFNKVELSLCEREEFIFELFKDKQNCLEQINILIKEMK